MTGYGKKYNGNITCTACGAETPGSPCPVPCEHCGEYICGVCGWHIESEREQRRCPSCGRKCCGDCYHLSEGE